jgi:GTPase Era involved in 16S rRNA processing
MTSSLDEPQDRAEERVAPAPASGSGTAARIAGLEAAATAAEGRLDPTLVAEAHAVVSHAAERTRLSADHTVVAIAGATGSGKSSTFNALTGLELSAVGVRRPTTSWATACVWGSEGAAELLSWLGIPERHQTTRDSMLDTRREDHSLDGVVLLDLPDHDSTEVSHHLEVDRLVSHADLLVWVLDPQKYADAAIHDRYLEPLRTHDEVMLVVLNHIDVVPEERRESLVADVRRLLDDDGLQRVPIVPVSARQGIGIDELRAEIRRRVEGKQATRARIEADVAAMAQRLEAASGATEPTALPPARVEAFEDALVEAAGVPTVVDAVERSTRLRAARATGWPVVSWVSALRPDPLTKLGLDLGEAGPALRGEQPAQPATAPVQRTRVDTEVRALVDVASEGMSHAWAGAVRREPVANIPVLADRLDAALAATDLGVSRLPGWVTAVRVVQWLLLLGAVGGGVWAVLAATGVTGDAPEVAGIPVPLVVLVAGLVLGVVLALVCRPLVAGAARKRAEEAEDRLRGAVSQVARELVVGPIEAEQQACTKVHRGILAALGRG